MKRILVTGASKGIGRAIAISLADKNREIIVHYHRDLKGAQDTIEQIKSQGGASSLMQFNIANREEVKEKLLVDIEKNGAYYGVVCNAGISSDAAFPALSDDDWDSVLRTNLDGFYNVVKPCVLPMIGRRLPGRILIMSSVSGIMGNRGQVNYSASKAGLIGAAKALAIELAKRNITVNCIAPGLIETDMVDETILKHAKHLIPMQRMGKVEEVAALAKFLISDEASYITRQVISVNGGMF